MTKSAAGADEKKVSAAKKSTAKKNTAKSGASKNSAVKRGAVKGSDEGANKKSTAKKGSEKQATSHETVDEMIISATSGKPRQKSFLGNPNVHFIVDTPGDFDPNIAKALGVTVIGFPYIIEGEEHIDDLFQTQSASKFYNAMRKGAAPTTSAISPGRYYEIFKECAKRGVPTIYLAFSRALSSSVDAARQAQAMIAEEYPDFELYVIDNRCPSGAAQLLAIEAVHQANLGATAHELVAWIKEARFFVHGLFTLENFDALARGGRIPAAAASLGGKLDMKPELSFDETGALTLKRICRGKKKALKAIIQDFIDESNGERSMPIGILTADVEHEGDWFESLIRKVQGCEDIPIVRSSVSPILGSHVGPGMIALVFWGSDRRETNSITGRIASRLGKRKK